MIALVWGGHEGMRIAAKAVPRQHQAAYEKEKKSLVSLPKCEGVVSHILKFVFVMSALTSSTRSDTMGRQRIRSITTYSLAWESTVICTQIFPYFLVEHIITC